MVNDNTVNQDPTKNKDVDADIAAPHYDPHLVPAETAARIEREREEFMHRPTKEDDQNQEVGSHAPDDSIDTTGGYTLDKEGLLNNYAIEPEMYVNTPGDLREKEAQLNAERRADLNSLAEDEQGNLTMDRDTRHKGQGII